MERLDERIQKLVEVVGLDESHARFIAPMYADLALGAFLRLLDLMPASAFAADRSVPPTFPSHVDPTVAAIVALLRERRELAQVGAS